MGLSAAFIFAAQMLNFPVAGGTSGHLIGGVLASVLLGPAAAVVVLTSVLIVQCFVFADGGIITLGANVFNMGIVSSVAGFFIYDVMRRIIPGQRGNLAAIAFASWCATVLAAVVCAGELSLSHTTTWPVALAAMMNVHMLIGVGEAVITTLVIFAVMRSRPDLMLEGIKDSAPSIGRWDVIVYGMLILIGVVAFVGPFACPWPDGLERVAKSLGFEDRATRLVQSPIAGYHLPGIGSATTATALAGVIGVVLAFGLGLLLAFVLVPRASETGESS
jgi:cobalt/nickel transport system permease protein